MAVRLIIELIVVLLVIAAVLRASHRSPRWTIGAPGPELDVSRVPATWLTDSRRTTASPR